MGSVCCKVCKVGMLTPILSLWLLYVGVDGGCLLKDQLRLGHSIFNESLDMAWASLSYVDNPVTMHGWILKVNLKGK